MHETTREIFICNDCTYGADCGAIWDSYATVPLLQIVLRSVLPACDDIAARGFHIRCPCGLSPVPFVVSPAFGSWSTLAPTGGTYVASSLLPHPCLNANGMLLL